MKIIDVSTFQGVIDWNKVKDEGELYGAILRAGYGKGNIDAQFVRNATECNRLGIPIGVYWFSYALNAADATEEAKYCLSAIQNFKIELPVCFDFEYDSESYMKKKGVTPKRDLNTAIVKAFCQVVEKAGYYSMVYANNDFLSYHFADLSAYDLWLAQWPKTVNLSKPPRKCGIWQWGSSTVPGISGTVDTNESYRDYVSVIRDAGLNHLQDAQQPEPPKDEQPAETDKPKRTAEDVLKDIIKIVADYLNDQVES